jgi:glutamate dehydrogenase (NAD(P)+)
VEDLVRRRDDKRLPLEDERVEPGAGDAFWDVPADVFVAAALSETVTAEVMDRLDAAGVRLIAAGANQPFREARLGSTAVARLADLRFAVLPDILANCGMARTFSYLMEGDARAEAEPVLAAVERTIRDTLDEVLERAGSGERGLLAATLGLALDRVGEA